MELRPFKFAVQAILTEHDEHGRIIGEHMHEPVVVYGVTKLAEYARDFEGALEQALKEQAESTTKRSAAFT